MTTATITRLHFSIIAFDQYDVEKSRKYLLIYDKIEFGTSGGFIRIPVELKDNLIIGFL